MSNGRRHKVRGQIEKLEIILSVGGNVRLLMELSESVQQYTATVIRSRDVDQSVINI
jgi:hypothetical protein